MQRGMLFEIGFGPFIRGSRWSRYGGVGGLERLSSVFFSFFAGGRSKGGSWFLLWAMMLVSGVLCRLFSMVMKAIESFVRKMIVVL